MESRAARATVWSMGLSVAPLALWLVVGWVGDIDSRPVGNVVLGVSCAVWLAAVAWGGIGVARCWAWRSRGGGGAIPDVLLLFNAAPILMALFLALLSWR